MTTFAHRRRNPARRRLLLLAVITALAAGPVSAEPVDGVPQGPGCVVPTLDDRCESWVTKFHQATRRTPTDLPGPWTVRTHDMAVAGTVAHSGEVAFAIGANVDWPSTCVNGIWLTHRYQTVAYDAVTGNVLWHSQIPAPDCSWYAYARAIAVSADDQTVFVTGTIVKSQQQQDIFVVAHEAASGAVKWTRVYDGPFGGLDDSFAIATSPTDGRVFVAGAVQASNDQLAATGYSKLYITRGLMAGPDVDADYALLALDGATGSVLSESFYGGAPFLVDGERRASWDVPTDIFVDPSGTRVTLAGTQDGKRSYRDRVAHLGVASFVADGSGWTLAWAQEIAGLPLGLQQVGDRLVVLGSLRTMTPSKHPYGIQALAAADGSSLWVKDFDLSYARSNVDVPRQLVADPARGTVFAGGIAAVGTDSAAGGVLALDVADGSKRWGNTFVDVRTQTTIIFNYDSDERPSLAVDRGTGDVSFVTLRDDRYIRTTRLDGATGTARWTALYPYPDGEAPPERLAFPWPVGVGVTAAGRTIVFGTVFEQLQDWCLSSSVLYFETPTYPFPCTRDAFLVLAYDR